MQVTKEEFSDAGNLGRILPIREMGISECASWNGGILTCIGELPRVELMRGARGGYQIFCRNKWPMSPGQKLLRPENVAGSCPAHPSPPILTQIPTVWTEFVHVYWSKQTPRVQISQLFIQGTRLCTALSGSRVAMGVLHTELILSAPPTPPPKKIQELCIMCITDKWTRVACSHHSGTAPLSFLGK